MTTVHCSLLMLNSVREFACFAKRNSKSFCYRLAVSRWLTLSVSAVFRGLVDFALFFAWWLVLLAAIVGGASHPHIGSGAVFALTCEVCLFVCFAP